MAKKKAAQKKAVPEEKEEPVIYALSYQAVSPGWTVELLEIQGDKVINRTRCHEPDLRIIAKSVWRKESVRLMKKVEG